MAAPFGLGMGDAESNPAVGYAPFGFQATDPRFSGSMQSGSMHQAPTGYAPAAVGSSTNLDDPEEEPPILEELGINFEHIQKKTKAVLVPTSELSEEILLDTDFAGPLVFCLGLGFCLLLTGKLHFGVIYGLFMVGCLGMYIILNLMSGTSTVHDQSQHQVDVLRVFSVQGYCLLPIVLLSVINVFLNLRGVFGVVLGLIAVCWCAYTSTRFFERALNVPDHKWLIAYPVFLQYATFALITIF